MIVDCAVKANGLGYSDDEIVELVSEALFSYLSGRIGLFHPGVGRFIQLEQIPDARDLAVLAQNKRYERRGAEHEQYLFTRGTPDGPRGNPQRDPLYQMTSSERIIYLSTNSDIRLYFEARNLLRNRAQEKAYENMHTSCHQTLINQENF